MFRAQSCRPGIRPAGRQADDFPCGSAAFLQQGIKKLLQKRIEKLCTMGFVKDIFTQKLAG